MSVNVSQDMRRFNESYSILAKLVFYHMNATGKTPFLNKIILKYFLGYIFLGK
jgi:hypothetical protein